MIGRVVAGRSRQGEFWFGELSFGVFWRGGLGMARSVWLRSVKAVEVRCGQVCSGFAWFGQLRRSGRDPVRSVAVCRGMLRRSGSGKICLGMESYGGRGTVRYGRVRRVGAHKRYGPAWFLILT